MNNEEFFPPTEKELERIIKILKFRLEDNSYRDEWEEISEKLKEKEDQLKNLIIQNNAL